MRKLLFYMYMKFDLNTFRKQIKIIIIIIIIVAKRV